MAFRFHNGRIITDEEFYSLGQSPVKDVLLGFTYAIGVLLTWLLPLITAAICFISLEYLGILIGFIGGLALSYFLYEPLIKLFQIITIIILSLIVLGFIGVLIYVIVTMK